MPLAGIAPPTTGRDPSDLDTPVEDALLLWPFTPFFRVPGASPYRARNSGIFARSFARRQFTLRANFAIREIRNRVAMRPIWEAALARLAPASSGLLIPGAFIRPI